MNILDNTKGIYNLGINCRNDTNEYTKSSGLSALDIPDLLRLKRSLKSFEPSKIRFALGNKNAVVHQRRDQALPPRIEEMLFVICRLQGLRFNQLASR